MIKVINKGYTITVVSWENDGDNYNTQSMTVDTIEKAKAIYDLCTSIFNSYYDANIPGIGNLMENEYKKAETIVVPYMKNHPELYEDNEDINETKLMGICLDYAYNLMGSSEYYLCRVMESCTITYSPEDIYLEEIKF